MYAIKGFFACKILHGSNKTCVIDFDDYKEHYSRPGLFKHFSRDSLTFRIPSLKILKFFEN